MTIETRNPTTDKVIEKYELMDNKEVNEILDKVHTDMADWQGTSFKERAKLMKEMGHLLHRHKGEYARLIAREMGKPIDAGEAEIEKCAWACEHYAEYAEHYLEPRYIDTEFNSSYVCYQPLGIIFAIMPWNFPFWQVFRFAVPTLMAGNGAVLKHAPITTGTAKAIESLFRHAGFPDHLFRALVIDDEGAKNVIHHDKVAAITLTGSPRAGKAVASEAAQSLKKVVLELGGSDPYVVLADADPELAAETCVKSRMKNTGQVCIAAKRIIVEKSVHNNLLQKLRDKLGRYQMDNPEKRDVDLGPLARRDIRDQVHDQVKRSIDQGAKLLFGGEIPDGDGFFYPPTLLDEVTKGMPAFDEEIFGPVVSIVTAEDEQQAIEMANDTPYGLGAAVFTQDVKRGEQIASEQLQAGVCAVNTSVTSDPRLPFGGIKQSGYGRELSQEGIQAFTNIKTVMIS